MERALRRPRPGLLQALVLALVLHAVLLAMLAVGLDWRWTGGAAPPRGQPVRARVVDAAVLDRARAAREAEQARRRQEARARAETRRKAEAARRRQAALEKRRAEAARRKALERKRLAEKRARAEAERRRQAEARRQARAKRQAEAARRRAELRERLAREERARALARRAGRLFSEYQALIRAQVERNWNRPPGIRPGLKAEFLVYTTPGGEVTRVQLLRSSGDAAFDRSALNAIYKATPLPFPEDREVAGYLSRTGFRFIFNPDQNEG